MPFSGGCWTCKVRRKKCSGNDDDPCEKCETLRIPCHRGVKPEWMDGGRRQADMAERLKREVRVKSHQRLISGDRRSSSTANVREEASPTSILSPTRKPCRNGIKRTGCPSQSAANSGNLEGIGSSPSETILLSFYLDHVLPFLLPFYHPDLRHEGGRAWIIHLVSTSPTFRQVALCQSSYFFALTQGTTSGGWDTVLTQTEDVFGMLRQAVEIMSLSSVQEHLKGAVRIFACIMQTQRFEIALKNFQNCRAHLGAALGLFYEILETGNPQSGRSHSRFAAVVDALGPSSGILGAHLPNAEQAALRFSTALLLFDDIIASTILKDPPKLYDYHESFLGGNNGCGDELLNLEGVVGCPNWVLYEIGKTAALDAWKHRCHQSGSLDTFQLAEHATEIRKSLQTQLLQLEAPSLRQCNANIFNTFNAPFSRPHRRIITQIWAHAALLYLLIVASGWQPSNSDVRFHVHQVVDLLHQLYSPSPLRALVWPLCIAGCLAEDDHGRIRSLADVLQPRNVYGTVFKALEIMERIWKDRELRNAPKRDPFVLLKDEKELILLV